MSYPDSLQVYEQAEVGNRVEVIHEVKVGFRRWPVTTVGTVVRKERRRRGEHFRRNDDDHVYADVLVLRRDDGELTTVALDEFSELKIVSS